jgi:hypothetical protein
MIALHHFRASPCPGVSKLPAGDQTHLTPAAPPPPLPPFPKDQIPQAEEREAPPPADTVVEGWALGAEGEDLPLTVGGLQRLAEDELGHLYSHCCYVFVASRPPAADEAVSGQAPRGGITSGCRCVCRWLPRESACFAQGWVRMPRSRQAPHLDLELTHPYHDRPTNLRPPSVRSPQVAPPAELYFWQGSRAGTSDWLRWSLQVRREAWATITGGDPTRTVTSRYGGREGGGADPCGCDVWRPRAWLAMPSVT